MPLDNEHGRWTQLAEHVQQLLDGILDAWPPNDHVAIRSTLSGLNSALGPYRLQADGDPPANPHLRSSVAPLIDALNDFSRLNAVASAQELRERMTALRDVADSAFTALSSIDTKQSETVDQVIDDFATEYRTSLILALTANHALSQILVAWQNNQTGDRSDADYLDLRTMQPVSEPTNATVSMSVLAASMTAPPSVLTPTTFARTINGEDATPPPPMFRMAYTQWFATIIAAWEDTYRPRLAAAHGVDEEGIPWTKDDVRSEFFYELNQVRHDVSHHAGICVESAGNTLIDWLTLGANTPIAPTTKQMLDFLDHFPDAELRRPLARTPRTTDRLPYQFDTTWIAKVKAHVNEIENVKAKRPKVIQSVIDAWMASPPGH